MVSSTKKDTWIVEWRDSPLNAYRIEHGYIIAPSGAKFSFEFGEYPEPVEDKDGDQYDEIVLRFKVWVLIDPRTGWWAEIETFAARHILAASGVLSYQEQEEYSLSYS